jgi:hypothetical protein
MTEKRVGDLTLDELRDFVKHTYNAFLEEHRELSRQIAKPQSPRLAFAHKLFGLASHALEFDDSAFSRLSGELMLEFLRFASETPENVNCYNHIEYGVVSTSDNDYTIKTTGLKIRGKDVLNHFEDLDVPESVRNRFPELTGNEWNAITRIATMLMITFENRQRIENQ